MAADKPPTEKQIAYLLRLAKVNGFSVDTDGLSRVDASSIIGCLEARNWKEPKMWNVRPFLKRP